MNSLYLEGAAFVAFPAVIATIAAILAWGNLSKPWVFFAVAVVVLYGLYAAVLFIMPSSQGYLLEAPTSQNQATSGQTFVFISAYFKQLAVFAVLALPTIWVLGKFFTSSK